jgi:hypothetical protein
MQTILGSQLPSVGAHPCQEGEAPFQQIHRAGISPNGPEVLVFGGGN